MEFDQLFSLIENADLGEEDEEEDTSPVPTFQGTPVSDLLPEAAPLKEPPPPSPFPNAVQSPDLEAELVPKPSLPAEAIPAKPKKPVSEIEAMVNFVQDAGVAGDTQRKLNEKNLLREPEPEAFQPIHVGIAEDLNARAQGVFESPEDIFQGTDGGAEIDPAVIARNIEIGKIVEDVIKQEREFSRNVTDFEQFRSSARTGLNARVVNDALTKIGKLESRKDFIQTQGDVPRRSASSVVGAGTSRPDSQVKLIENLEQEIQATRVILANAVNDLLVNNIADEGEPELRIATRPVMLAMQAAQADGQADVVDALVLEFFGNIAFDVTVSSLAQQGLVNALTPVAAATAAKLVTGATRVAAAAFSGGVGVAAFNVESKAAFTQFLQDEQVDLRDTEAVRDAFQDRDFIKRGKSFALKRGASVAAWEVLSAYLAAGVRIPDKFLGKMTTTLSNFSFQLAQGTTAGVLGEATATFVTGKEQDRLQLILEGMGETIPSTIDPVLFTLADKLGSEPKDLIKVGKLLDSFMKGTGGTLAELALALNEISKRGVTEAEILKLIAKVPGLSPKILENSHSNAGTRADLMPGAGLEVEVKSILFTDTEGNEISGSDLLDSQVQNERAGQVYWSTGKRTPTAENPNEVSSTETTLNTLKEALVAKSALIKQNQGVNSDPKKVQLLENQVLDIQERIEVITKARDEMQVVRPEIQKFVEQVARVFFPGQDIIVIEDNQFVDSNDKQKLGRAGPFEMSTVSKTTSVISLNTRRLLDLAIKPNANIKDNGTNIPVLLTNLAHEVGHTLMQQLITQLPKGVMAALRALHRQYVAEALKNTSSPISEILKTVKDPVTFESFFSKAKGTIDSLSADSQEQVVPGVQSKKGVKAQEDLNYLLSFNEFAADLMARQLGLENSPINEILEKILSKADQKQLTGDGLIKTNFTRISNILKTYFKKHVEDPTGAETYALFLKFLQAKEADQAVKGFADSFTSVEKSLPSGANKEIFFSLLRAKGIDIPKAVKEQIESSLDTYNIGIRFFINLLQLGKENPHILGLRKAIGEFHGHAVTKANWNNRAMITINKWRSLGKRGDDLGRFVLALTLLSDKLGRKPTSDEMTQLIKDEGINTGKDSTAFWDTFRNIETDFRAVLENMLLLEQNRLRSDLAENPVRLKGKLAELQQNFDKLFDKYYFPLSRFGTLGIRMVVKPGKAVEFNGKTFSGGQVAFFEMYETKRQRDRALGTLTRKFGSKVKPQFTRIEEDLKPFTGLTSQLIVAIRDNKALGLTVEQKAKLQDMIDDRSPTNGIAKRMLERKGVAGFSEDALRGYGNYMLEAGSHIARMQHRPAIDAAIDEVRASAVEIGRKGLINDKRHEIAQHLVRHRDYMFNPQNEWGALRALAFHWFIGYVVKSAAVNLTQVPMVAYPYLASRKVLTGKHAGKADAKAIFELGKAGKEIRWSFEKNKHNFTAAEQSMFSILQAEGLIDESLATDVVGLAHGDMISRILPKESRILEGGRRLTNGFERGSVAMFQMAEKFNRRLVGLATYRLAIKAGLPPAVAIDEAREAIRTTQFEYARWNRAAFQRGRLGVLTVFMQWTQNSAYFVMRDPGRVRYAAMMLAMAGVQGVFAVDDLLEGTDLLRRIYRQQMGKPGRFIDTRGDISQFMQWLDLNPELMMHGLASMSMGLSLPSVSEMLGITVPGLSLESSVGTGNVVPGLRAFLNPNRLTASGINEGVKDVLGAALSIPINIMSWARDASPDKIRSFERMAPNFLKNPARVMRMVRDGGLDTPDGKQIIDFDASNPVHIAEAVSMFFGFPPTRLLRKQERTFTEKQAFNFYQGLRQAIKANYFYARDQGDLKAARSIIEIELADYNKHTFPGQELTNLGSEYAKHLLNRAKAKQEIPDRILNLPLKREVDKRFTMPTSEPIK